MADGGVRIDVGLNVSKAERDLEKLKNRIKETEDELNSDSGRKLELEDQIAQVGFQLDEATKKVRDLKRELQNSRGNSKTELREQVADAVEEQRLLQSQLNSLLKEYDNVKESIDSGTQSLGEMTEEAGELEGALSRSRFGEGLSQTINAAKQSLTRFVKYALGIGSVLVLFNKMKNAIRDSVLAFAEYDSTTKANIEGLKNALSTLKVSWGAAFAPIFNAVVPILQTLISWLTAAANAVARFIAIVSGASSYKKAIANNNALAESLGGAGAAAEEAKKQIMGFDELNLLNDDKSGGGGGGGGGGGDGTSFIDEAVDALDGSFLSNLALSFRDVFFNWDDMNPEVIAEKILAGLGGLLGLALGISLGLGPGGIILMTIAGITLGLIADALIFNHDGKLSKTELTDMILLIINGIVGGIAGFAVTKTAKGALIGATVAVALTLAIKTISAKTQGTKAEGLGEFLTGALTMFGGGMIGWQIGGGPVGAIIGTIAGLVLTLAVSKIRLEMARRDAFYGTEFGQQVQAIKDEAQRILEVDADLKVRINSITGEIDSATIAEFNAAQSLIDQIFTIDAKENLTAAEIEKIKALISEVNSLGLEGISVQFDEVTGHVVGSRAEIQGMLDDLLQQYQLQAMGDAYVESFKAQYEAETQAKQATENATAAANAYNDALGAVKTAQDNYNTALAEYNLYADELASAGSGGFVSQAAQDAAANLQTATDALTDAKIALGETKTAAEESSTALETALTTYDEALAKCQEIGDSFTEVATQAGDAGTDTVEGYAEKVRSGTPEAAEAVKGMGEDALDALRTALDSHSPSKKTEEEGRNFIQGFEDGISSGLGGAQSAVANAMETMLATVSDYVSRMQQLWNSDWGSPHMAIPVFSLAGGFNLQTGETPWVNVDWAYLAKGGIIDGLTPLIAGEQGKEAIVPLEKNTEWISLVANGLMEKFEQSNFASRLADAFTSVPFPAMAGGGLVPPRSIGNGSVLSDGDLSRIAAAISGALSGSMSEDIKVGVYLDGRELSEVVTKWQKRSSRGMGV